MNGTAEFPRQRLSTKAKERNNFQWAKDVMDHLDGYAFSSFYNTDDKQRKKVNFDLYNGILNEKDFEYVAKPYGERLQMPAKLQHYDIVSPKLRVVIGEQIKRPFNYKVVDNSDSSFNAKMREKTRLLREYVISLMQEEEQITQQTEIEVMDPRDIEKYIKRSYSTASEKMGQSLLTYLVKKQDCKRKFSKGFKQALIGGEEVYYVGIKNNEPVHEVVNDMFFEYDRSPDLDFIEDGEWAREDIYMMPASVIDSYGKFLTNKEIDRIYDGDIYSDRDQFSDFSSFLDFGWEQDDAYYSRQQYTRVRRFVWKSLVKIGFLDYLDENGVEQTLVVDENYKLNPDAGDIKITWEWVPQVWHGVKIGTDIYVDIKPIEYQGRSADNPYACKLPYYGLTYNNLNAQPVSLVDRMKPYQYLYDIIMYRLELDLASDKGKKFLADINQVPTSLGMDFNQWMYYFDALGIAWVNPHEEGNRGQASNFNQFTSIDLTMGQQIQQKIYLLEYLDQRCGQVAGINAQREGQTSSNELVTNAQQNVVQSTHITEEWFYLHNEVQRRVLAGLLETARYLYSTFDTSKTLQYVLDDLSLELIKLDSDVLDLASYNIFISDSSRESETTEMLKQLTHAAMQNQQIELSDVIDILTTDSISEKKENLKIAEELRREQASQEAQQQMEMQQQIANQQIELEQLKLELEKYKIDKDNATKLEIAGLKEDDSDRQQLDLKKKELDHKIKYDNEKLDIERMKANRSTSNGGN